jgi:hypothetical protein
MRPTSNTRPKNASMVAAKPIIGQPESRMTATSGIPTTKATTHSENALTRQAYTDDREEQDRDDYR